MKTTHIQIKFYFKVECDFKIHEMLNFDIVLQLLNRQNIKAKKNLQVNNNQIVRV